MQGPESYTEIFKDKNVGLVVRLNTSQYSRRPFLRAGVNHLDLFFADCTSPPDQIVHEFLIAAEECKGMVAVHCAAGLGRTGTLIALYLMKHHGFTGRQCIAWLRVARPGSIIGPQQKYLVLQQDRLAVAEWRVRLQHDAVRRADNGQRPTPLKPRHERKNEL